MRKEPFKPQSPVNEEKNENIKQIFEDSYVTVALAIMLKFGMWSAEGGGCLRKMIEGALNYICMKIMFCFFL